MKYALILPDGAADEPIPALNDQTPLQAAKLPHMDWIAANGRVGTVRTVPAGFVPGSDVATLSVVGYDVTRCYTGRAPLEAVARRITLEPDALVFRCNLVTIADGRMVDFSAGHISQAEAEKLIADLQAAIGSDRIRFYPGVSYRHLMTLRDADWMKVEATPPHDIPGEPVGSYLPAGKGSDVIRSIMAKAAEVLENHEVNQVRRDLGENPATAIWLWGHGPMPRIEPFRTKFGLTGAGITGVDLFRGVVLSAGWRLIEVPGATGYLDTNYKGKGEAAVKAIDEVDIVAVHVEAPDEAGHNGDVVAKVKALERIDELVVGPVLDKLRSLADWRIMVAPDHPTPCAKRTHTDTPPPFCMAGRGILPDRATEFNESAAAESDLHIDPGYELMEYFLKAGRKG
ncbi:MAG: cofactor-independent phosphoglycerate mutase [Planctomycetes bacterium]|nr:cofactor-independent phosphoglycerate mutase [Planctomycetota bacterium]